MASRISKHREVIGQFSDESLDDVPALADAPSARRGEGANFIAALDTPVAAVGRAFDGLQNDVHG